eukprot:GHVR01151384.1.p1 GENE.GHVR01151384.1~~GHVR01151384.1.p1  ORF type:complete len:556 (+),score=84.35 GHVR01151384.1:2354-4021(+)
MKFIRCESAKSAAASQAHSRAQAIRERANANNPNRKAIALVHEIGKIHHAPPLIYSQIVHAVADAVSRACPLYLVPDADAPVAERHAFLNVQLAAIYSYSTSEHRDKLIEPVPPLNISAIVDMFTDDPLLGNVVVSLFKKIKDSAGNGDKCARAATRARAQYVPENEVKEIVADPEIAAAYLQQDNQDLRHQLDQIESIVARDGNDFALSRKQQMLRTKHKHWYNPEQGVPGRPATPSTTGNFLPNDNSVCYVFLLFEMLVLLRSCRCDTRDDLITAFHAFCSQINKIFETDSINKAYDRLKLCPPTHVPLSQGGTVDIAGAIRSYANDVQRNKKSSSADLDTNSHLQRTPRRAQRIMQNLGNIPGSFQVLNAVGKPNFGAAVLKLWLMEQQVSEQFAHAKQNRDALVDFSDAESIVYVVFQGRHLLTDNMHGRSDLTPVGAFATILGDTTLNRPLLQPRIACWRPLKYVGVICGRWMVSVCHYDEEHDAVNWGYVGGESASQVCPTSLCGCNPGLARGKHPANGAKLPPNQFHRTDVLTDDDGFEDIMGMLTWV